MDSLSASLSRFGTLPASVTVSGLKEADRRSARPPSKLTSAAISTFSAMRFAALNTAFAEDGAFVHVGRGVSLDAPIHLLFVSTAADAPRMIHPRNLLIFEQESEATVDRRICLTGRRHSPLQQRDRTDRWRELDDCALHGRAREPGCVQHFYAAHSAGTKRERRFPFASAGRRTWSATTFIRCWPAKAESA